MPISFLTFTRSGPHPVMTDVTARLKTFQRNAVLYRKKKKKKKKKIKKKKKKKKEEEEEEDIRLLTGLLYARTHLHLCVWIELMVFPSVLIYYSDKRD